MYVAQQLECLTGNQMNTSSISIRNSKIVIQNIKNLRPTYFILTKHKLSVICRYVAIVHPLKPQLRRTHARLMIVPVWAISLVLVSPYMASLEMKDGECMEDFTSAGMNPKYYTIGIFITQYVVPLSIIAFSYIR